GLFVECVPITLNSQSGKRAAEREPHQRIYPIWADCRLWTYPEADLISRPENLHLFRGAAEDACAWESAPIHVQPHQSTQQHVLNRALRGLPVVYAAQRINALSKRDDQLAWVAVPLRSRLHPESVAPVHDVASKASLESIE